jgi:hypothetical protein
VPLAGFLPVAFCLTAVAIIAATSDLSVQRR